MVLMDYVDTKTGTSTTQTVAAQPNNRVGVIPKLLKPYYTGIYCDTKRVMVLKWY